MRSHQEYVESGVWKCEESPTGAHWWVESTELNLFECKYCHATKKFRPQATTEDTPTAKTKRRKHKVNKLHRSMAHKPYVRREKWKSPDTEQ
jgi:hypothetical protein